MTEFVYRRYSVYRLLDGEITANMHAATAEDVALNTPPGHGAVEGDFTGGVIRDGRFVAYTEAQQQARATRPTHPAEWSNATMAWLDARSLAQIRAARWDDIKAMRLRAEESGFAWDGSSFDSDRNSQSRIQSAALLAMQAAPGFTLDWTLADNTVRPLTAEDMIGVSMALSVHMAVQHAIARSLRAAIDAAATPAQVQAVSWL